jgi:tryptophan synthase alpha chain
VSRIAARFEALKREGRGGLVTYLQAYDPDPACSMAILRGLPGAGADVVEIGVPFSDPMADGPSIQKAAQRALKAGATLAGVLAMVRDFRAEDEETPVVLMGYLNPVLSYGVPRFCCDAAASGVDGLIVVDVPPEEAGEIEPHARDAGLDLIRLVAPTTDEARLPRVLAATSGFVYYVSITGITGTRSATAEHLAEAVPRIRRHTDLPIAIGFGIRTPQQAAEAARLADAAVVGSALVDTLAAGLDEKGRARPETRRQVLDQVRALAEAVRGARQQGDDDR